MKKYKQLRSELDEGFMDMMKGLVPTKRRSKAKSMVGGSEFIPKGTEKITPNLYNKIWYGAMLELYQQPSGADNTNKLLNKHAKKNGVASWAKVEEWRDFWEMRMTDAQGNSSLWSEDWMGVIINLGYGPFRDHFGKEKLKKYNTNKGSEFDKAFTARMDAQKNG